MELSKLEKTIGHKFTNKDLLKEALTHRSYINENPKWGIEDNERLEFLGDAVLELSVTEELFKRFPERKEGAMTSYRAALVNYVMLAKIAGEIDLDKFIMLSKGEARDTGKAREVILANAMESLIGAIYLDAGQDAARKFINDFVLEHLGDVYLEMKNDPQAVRYWRLAAAIDTKSESLRKKIQDHEKRR